MNLSWQLLICASAGIVGRLLFDRFHRWRDAKRDSHAREMARRRDLEAADRHIELLPGKRRPPVKAWLDLFNSAEPMMKALPIHFSNGATVDELTFTCGQCKVQVPADCFRGQEIEGARGDATFETVAYCEGCKTTDAARMRLYPTHDNGGSYGIEMTFHKAPAPPVSAMSDGVRALDLGEGT